ncbi:hypothetical protein F7725_006058 [Dissostichus mawsoni]|uniref:tRNA pseudouridine(55) synthase n=1 Tax=Dissostichus mawsoni TaxID=36200 RepID=A0A7J5YU55_DISMA|nr:hypothetical protein F7725_006058 [Dissostichus mawsoni]
MLPLKEKDKPVVQKLLSAGCCARCVLRFCCVSVQAAYRKPHQETLKELQAFIGNTENGKSQDSVAADSTEENNKSHDATVPEPADEPADDPPSKRAKLEISGTEAPSEEDAAEEKLTEEPSVCGVFGHPTGTLWHDSGREGIAEKVKAEKYEFETLVLSVSLPAQLCVREHSCWLHVKKELREKSMAVDKDDVVQVKEAFKWVLQGLVAKEIGGVAVVARSLFEISVGATTCADCFRPTKNKQGGTISTAAACLRSLGFNFSSSGREDVDVRTLGTGRPFAMELLNPHRSKLSREEMKLLQETIKQFFGQNQSERPADCVQAMGKMKEGEEDKTKSYTALVWTLKPIQSEDIAFIDDIKDLTLDQKTPLRVLHRRALAVRPRVVHSMKTRFLDSHHFYLEMKTQAGTYIKEFVHGDFGRTKPNLFCGCGLASVYPRVRVLLLSCENGPILFLCGTVVLNTPRNIPGVRLNTCLRGEEEAVTPTSCIFIKTPGTASLV